MSFIGIRQVAAMSPSRRPATQQTAFRLPPDLIRRLDKLAARYSREQPGLSFTRADVVRVLLARSVAAEEARHEKAPT